MDVITITDINNCQKEITEGSSKNSTLRINKPVVIISARVHPA